MKKRRVCLRALCEEHSPIPAQEVGQSRVSSVIVLKGCSIRESSSVVSSRARPPHRADVDRGRRRNATFSSGPFYPSLQTLKIKCCFIK